MTDTKSGAQQFNAQLISKNCLYYSNYFKLFSYFSVRTSSAVDPNAISKA
jgi:hypothetical protein